MTRQRGFITTGAFRTDLAEQAHGFASGLMSGAASLGSDPLLATQAYRYGARGEWALYNARMGIANAMSEQPDVFGAEDISKQLGLASSSYNNYASNLLQGYAVHDTPWMMGRQAYASGAPAAVRTLGGGPLDVTNLLLTAQNDAIHRQRLADEIFRTSDQSQNAQGVWLNETSVNLGRYESAEAALGTFWRKPEDRWRTAQLDISSTRQSIDGVGSVASFSTRAARLRESQATLAEIQEEIQNRRGHGSALGDLVEREANLTAEMASLAQGLGQYERPVGPASTRDALESLLKRQQTWLFTGGNQVNTLKALLADDQSIERDIRENIGQLDKERPVGYQQQRRNLLRSLYQVQEHESALTAELNFGWLGRIMEAEYNAPSHSAMYPTASFRDVLAYNADAGPYFGAGNKYVDRAQRTMALTPPSGTDYLRRPQDLGARAMQMVLEVRFVDGNTGLTLSAPQTVNFTSNNDPLKMTVETRTGRTR